MVPSFVEILVHFRSWRFHSSSTECHCFVLFCYSSCQEMFLNTLHFYHDDILCTLTVTIIILIWRYFFKKFFCINFIFVYHKFILVHVMFVLK